MLMSHSKVQNEWPSQDREHTQKSKTKTKQQAQTVIKYE
jgi:hypothetical protein